jgi:hypothetical protein
MLVDLQYTREATVAGRWGSMLAVPMLCDGTPIGAIVITRNEIGPIFGGGNSDGCPNSRVAASRWPGRPTLLPKLLPDAVGQTVTETDGKRSSAQGGGGCRNFFATAHGGIVTIGSEVEGGIRWQVAAYSFGLSPAQLSILAL